MRLIESRKKYNLTIKELTDELNIPLRTYLRYEKDEKYGSKFKREAFINLINSRYEINENKGILKKEIIFNSVKKIAKKHKNGISYVYLFGSYAKENADEKSDVDLLISTSLKGFDYVGLAEEFRRALNKKIDLVSVNNMVNSIDFVNEILKYGIKIYG